MIKNGSKSKETLTLFQCMNLLLDSEYELKIYINFRKFIKLEVGPIKLICH